MTQSSPQPTASTSVLNEVISGLAANLKNIGIYVAALTALVLGLTELRQHVEGLLPERWQWLWPVVASLPLAAALLGHGIPLLIARRRRQRLEDEAVHTTRSPPPSGYFRIAPYGNTEEDRARYSRADGMHETVLKWLAQSQASILYLTGVSGAGKSSLLHAYVIPNLPQQSTVSCAAVRNYRQPLETLRTELLKPGFIWKSPPGEPSDLFSVLEIVSRQLGKRRLLIVFDQFEEFLIIGERDPDGLRAMREFLSSFVAKQIPNVTLLLVLRSDYVGMLMQTFGKPCLPPLNWESNWKEVSAFRERDARNFLEASGLQIGPALMDEIFRQIAEIEETDGLVRPITLNMIGVILDRSAISKARLLHKRGDGGSLVLDYLRRCIGRAEVKDSAPLILRRMITRAGTREPKATATLAQETGLSVGVVIGCLQNLAKHGLVRRLDEAEDVWEISHDFVARLLDRVLNRWSKDIWQMARTWLLPVALSVWAIVFVLLPAVKARQITGNDVTARVTFSSVMVDADTGDWVTLPQTNLFEGSCELEIGAAHGPAPANRWTNGLLIRSPELQLTSDVETTRRAENATVDSLSVTQIKSFSQFRGSLGKFRDPGAWDKAQIEACLTAHSISNSSDYPWWERARRNSGEARNQFDQFYGVSSATAWADSDYSVTPLPVEATLEILVGGQVVATSKGWVARVFEHDEDVRGLYVTKFKIVTLDKPFAEIGPRKAK